MGNDGDEEDREASDMGSHGEEQDGDEEDREASDKGSDGEKQGEDSNPNAGWAEAMAKILGKKIPESKPIILLKNKELDKIKEKEKKERLEKKKQVKHLKHYIVILYCKSVASVVSLIDIRQQMA